MIWLGCLLAAPARADWQSLSANEFALPAPPAAGSAAYKQDFETLLSLQASRTQRQCDLALEMKIPTFTAVFGPSELLTPQEMASVKPFLDAVSMKAFAVNVVFKKRYARPRPYVEDRRVQPCADKPEDPGAYPSGHAMEGVVYACVLGRIFPNRSERIDAWGQYVGQLRAISGAHHPSDVAAGRALGESICSWLLEHGDFNAEIARLRAAPR